MRVRFSVEAAREFSSPELTLSADFSSVSVPLRVTAVARKKKKRKLSFCQKCRWLNNHTLLTRRSRSELVSWCFEPSQPQRIRSELNTNFTLSPSHIHFTSHHSTSHVFWAYLYSVGTQHGNLHPAGWPILFCGPKQEPVLATANTGKIQERFWKKMQVNGPEG